MSKKFSDYNFPQAINDVLAELNFVSPTKIQDAIIPKLRKRTNVVGISQTGSGKTHSFLLPVVERINLDKAKTQAIIMVPTRELAIQIHQNILVFTKKMPQLKSALIIGGTNLDHNKQIDAQIIVGTPGRLMEAINDKKIIALGNLNDMVIDEADMIFDANFIKEADQVMAHINDKVVFSIFSATITQNMYPFLKKYFEDIKIIEVDNNVNENVKQFIIPTKSKDKYDTLRKLMGAIDPYLCLIFASKKEDVIALNERLNQDGINTIAIHGDLPSRSRAKTLKRVNSLEFKYVVCSDIAARGIDIDGVSHVISMDMPYEIEYFIHRSGRTGRHHYTGSSFFIYANEDEKEIQKLEQRGLSFEYYDIVNKELVPNGIRVRSQNKKNTDLFESEHINKLSTKKNNKVKPGYKKKRKLALEKMKKKAKQAEVKQRIKKQRKVRKQS